MQIYVLQTIRPESGFRIVPNRMQIGKKAVTSQFLDITSSSNSFNIIFFLLSSVLSGPGFMSISSLVLGL